jgi:peptidoglycan/LPS O-acetylase OafA/YrhL
VKEAAGVRRPSPEAGGGVSIEQAGERRSASLESLRAIAALGVLAGHVYGVSQAFGPSTTDTYLHRIVFGGGFGVYLFFGLTGYLLFWPFAKRWFGGGTAIDLRRYGLNRALRILPLYYVVLIICMVLLEHGGSPGQWWRFLLFGENFFTSTVGKVDGPMWSLVVELHFYVLLPLLAWGLARVSRRSLGRAALVLGVLAIASFGLHFVKVENAGGFPDLRWQYSLPATFGWFAAGMLLALLRLHWETAGPPRLVRGPLRSSGVWILGSVVLALAMFYDYRLVALAGAAAFLLIGACVLPLRGGRSLRALEWRPLAAIGVASYSLYLWHFVIVGQLNDHVTSDLAPLLALALSASLAAALLSYHVVEAPFLRLRRRWSPAAAQQETTSASTAAVPIAATSGETG